MMTTLGFGAKLDCYLLNSHCPRFLHHLLQDLVAGSLDEARQVQKSDGDDAFVARNGFGGVMHCLMSRMWGRFALNVSRIHRDRLFGGRIVDVVES